MIEKKSILVVEDEKPLRNALLTKLEREGFAVQKATNGKEGLEVALREKPDLILLDIVMPVMDGVTMLEQLRTDDWGKTASIIMLTNLNDWDNTKRAADMDVKDFLVKSDWKLADLIEKVRKKLG